MANKSHGRCLVCDGVAIGLNFGVSTCMPCKAFFRRNAVKLGTRNFVCLGDGDCLVSYKHGRLCNCCRLAKCFRVGMKKSMILSDEEREARNKLVEMNRLKRGKIPKQECVEWMKPSTSLCVSKRSVQCLSSSDQVVLANIFNAYENTCMRAKKTQFQCFPAVPHTSIHEFLNEFSSSFQIFLEYFKNIPEFDSIIMDDKVRLVKSHFGIMINMNEPLMHPITSNNLIITWTNVFGINLTKRLLKRTGIMEQYIYDPLLLKILLIILVLSSNNVRHLNHVDIIEIYDNSLSIYAAQNVYIELLWRYILSRSETEKNAVKFYNKLIMCILYTQNLDMDIDSYVTSLTHEIQQMEPLMQNMWPRNDQIIDITDDEIIV
ncbi:unnamed protein product [Adineta steineri]|uniref:Nuclear receptor domain-containing protein n=1 Tax=Adineta steineri TaxID=433720 RepID=A0A813T5B2_9BILA|nr:unnamed protein product [Adineta steineri]CAF0929472.1 unnamed protein product [Adineta steineri]